MIKPKTNLNKALKEIRLLRKDLKTLIDLYDQAQQSGQFMEMIEDLRSQVYRIASYLDEIATGKEI